MFKNRERINGRFFKLKVSNGEDIK